MTQLGDGNFYGADMHSGNFGEANSQIKLHDNIGSYITIASEGEADFMDSMSDNVKIVYKYVSGGLYVVFLKKSDETFRFGFFEDTPYTNDETAAANYTEGDVNALIDTLPASWQGNFDLTNFWPQASSSGGASGDPFVTPILC